MHAPNYFMEISPHTNVVNVLVLRRLPKLGHVFLYEFGFTNVHQQEIYDKLYSKLNAMFTDIRHCGPEG